MRDDFVSLDPIPELVFPASMTVYTKMYLNDPVIGGLMRRIQRILCKARRVVHGGDFDDAVLSNVVKGLTTALIYGFYVGEIVVDAAGNIDVVTVNQQSITDINLDKGTVSQGTVTIPLSKCIFFRLDDGLNSTYGTSLLRHVYKPYYYKASIEARETITLERDLGGLPVIHAPEGFDFLAADESSPTYNEAVAATLDWAIDLVSNMKRDSQQGAVIPYGWKLELLRGDGSYTGQTSSIIQRHDANIAAALLQEFVTLNAGREAATTHLTSFLQACDSLLLEFAQCINTQLFDRYSKWFGTPKMTITFDSVQVYSLSELASFVARLVDKQVIMPTTKLEQALLRIANLPEREVQSGT